MDKKLYIIYLLGLVVLSSFVSAMLTNNNTLLLCLKFDDTGSILTDCKTNDIPKFDFSYNGTLPLQPPIANHSINSYNFSSNGEFFVANNTAINTVIQTMKNWTAIGWIGSPNYDFTVDIWGFIPSDGESGFKLGAEVGGELIMTLWTSSGWSFKTGTIFVKESCIAQRYNGTAYAIFINGTERATFTGDPNPILFEAENFVFGNAHLSSPPTSAYNGSIDDFSLHNQSLSPNDIIDVCSNGITTIAETGIPVPPVIVAPSPSDNANNNTNVTLNVTHSTTQNDVRYYLYFGNSTPLGELDLFLNNVTRTAEEYRSFLTNVSDGVYFYKWKVQNITSGNFSTNTTQRTWTLDTLNPTITLNPNNAFNTSNIATISQYADSLFFNITATDDSGLFGFLINVTRGGVSFFNYTNVTFEGIGNFTFNFTQNISTFNWPVGVFNITVMASDSHTANLIGDYKPNNGINTIEFDTLEGNNIKISSDGSAYSTLYNKKKDRYEFGWNYLFTDSTRKFTIESESKIYYLQNSKYQGHFVIIGNGVNGNWIDFEGIGEYYSVKKVNDYRYEITFINLVLTNQIISKSLGGVNLITEEFKWYNGNVSTSEPTVSTFGNLETFILNISRNSTFARPNATFIFDGVEFSTTSSFIGEYMTFSKSLSIPQPVGESQIINFSWNVTITQSDDSIYNFSIPSSINISESLLDNCSSYNRTVLVIKGRDEETDIDVNTTVNILFIPKSAGTGINNSYELSGQTNYSFCTDSDINFTLDSIMEFGDGTIYTDRKYYLNNFSVDTSTIAEVFLFHLNNTKASEITFTVFDTTTGDKVSGAFIKILRFYPGEDVFRVVEIERTDEVGETLGKMVLADVFYKFIVEAPAGTVKLETDVLRILSLTRSLGISFTEDVLDTWDKIHGVSNSVTCTKSTQTCRFTWSDSSNIVQDATLEIWRTNGITDALIFSQTTTAAAGTISHTITESTLGNDYTAKGFIESNTGTSLYGVGIASLIFPDNPFFTDKNQRLAALFPLFLLVVVIIFALIDFGVVGVVIGSLLGMIIGSIVDILPLSPFYFISFILMGAILIYKLSK